MKKNTLIIIIAILCSNILGHTWSSNQAIGYPTTHISTTSNPIWAFGGTVTNSSGINLATAPSDQMMVVTDIHLFSNISCCQEEEVLIKIDGTIVSRSTVIDYSSSRASSPVQISLQSGIPVPAGSIISIHSVFGSNVNYTITGYYAQP